MAKRAWDRIAVTIIQWSVVAALLLGLFIAVE